jgi:hypothetical protein
MKHKRHTDHFGDFFQDALTENESKPRGAVRDEIEATLQLDPNVDSQDGDQAMAENRFGLNKPKQTEKQTEIPAE